MRLLCATDFSEPAVRAEEEAVRLARRVGGEVIYVHVAVETPLYGEQPIGGTDTRAVYEAQRRWAVDALTTRVEQAKADGVAARQMLRVGTPVDEVLAAASEENVDMIVIGTHGRTGLDRWLLGSVAERIVRRAPCPVLTVRPPGGRA